MNNGWRAALSRAPLSAFVAMVAGLVVLLGAFLDIPLLADLRRLFLHWAVILAAVALLVGVANLALVHLDKIVRPRPGAAGGFYSFVLLLALAATLLLAGLYGPTSNWSLWIFNYIQVPIESSLMAVLAAVLVLAAARLLRRRPTPFSMVFLGTALLLLLGASPLLRIELPWLPDLDGLRGLLQRVPAVAGARGLLLGIALGTVATGLRVLMAADRPYTGD